MRAPVSGYVTHLRLRPGDYATAGVTTVAIIDGQSFWVVGYFEETRLRHIHIGDTAHITLMGYDPVITGHVETSGTGSAIPMMKPAPWACRRSSQRSAGCGWRSVVPVRIHIDTLPAGWAVAGLSATISVIPDRTARRAGQSSIADLLSSQ